MIHTSRTASVEATRRLVTHLAASFPVWRFPAMRAGDICLFEAFGLTRLTRPTDVRDPALPPSNPQRDEFGVGFTAALAEGGAIEFRRAYLGLHLGGTHSFSLLVRNNASYFGRDRLPAPVLLCTSRASAAALQALTPAEAWDTSRWHAWDPDGADRRRQPQVEAAARLLATWDAQFARWLADRHAGLPVLGRFLDALAAAGRPLPYLTRQRALHDIRASLVPDAAVRAALHQGGQGSPELTRLCRRPGRLVLTSGPGGDLISDEKTPA